MRIWSMRSTCLYVSLLVMMISDVLALRAASEDESTEPSLLATPGASYTRYPSVRRQYKLVYRAADWQTASRRCRRDRARLAVPENQEQFDILQRIVRKTHYPEVTGTDYRLMAWVGVSSLDDYSVWKNVYGKNIMETNFHTWSGENGKTSDNPNEPHCAGIDAVNAGLRSWWCHRPLIYICEIKI